MFLMYRVELKAERIYSGWTSRGTLVPNVPCGVERLSLFRDGWAGGNVPNVPCGVERLQSHRSLDTVICSVPNVPCGVERPCERYNLAVQKFVPNVPCGVERYRHRRLTCSE